MLTVPERDQALDVAVRAVVEPLTSGRRWLPDLDVRGPALAQDGACFVTLRRSGDLLGCIGSLTPRQPLGIDVAHNAAAAGFDDPRLPVLTRRDLPLMQVHVSVLGPLTRLPVRGWAELRDQLRPGVDGLLVEDPRHRATFLPAVWQSLPAPEAFLDALWRKAGLSPRGWPSELQVSRYVVEELSGWARDHEPT